MFIKDFCGASLSSQSTIFVLANNYILIAIFKSKQRPKRKRRRRRRVKPGTEGKEKHKTLNENERQNKQVSLSYAFCNIMNGKCTHNSFR